MPSQPPHRGGGPGLAHHRLSPSTSCCKHPEHPQRIHTKLDRTLNSPTLGSSVIPPRKLVNKVGNAFNSLAEAVRMQPTNYSNPRSSHRVGLGPQKPSMQSVPPIPSLNYFKHHPPPLPLSFLQTPSTRQPINSSCPAQPYRLDRPGPCSRTLYLSSLFLPSKSLTSDKAAAASWMLCGQSRGPWTE